MHQFSNNIQINRGNAHRPTLIKITALFTRVQEYNTKPQGIPEPYPAALSVSALHHRLLVVVPRGPERNPSRCEGTGLPDGREANVNSSVKVNYSSNISSGQSLSPQRRSPFVPGSTMYRYGRSPHNLEKEGKVCWMIIFIFNLFSLSRKTRPLASNWEAGLNLSSKELPEGER